MLSSFFDASVIMPSSASSSSDPAQPNNNLWLKKHLNVWKARSSEAESMRLKAYEKVVAKAVGKAKYRHPSKCKNEVFNTVKIYRGLTPQFDKFVFDNGDVAQMLNLNGTIPVDYKGATYNIPVCIWLLLDFPNVAPMSFVVPTKDMQLKVSHHVDHTGKIYLDYLALWSPGVSTILGLIQACREAFGQLPPVFSKVSSSSSCTSSPSVTTTITSTSSSSSGRQQSSDRQLDNNDDPEVVSKRCHAEKVLRERFAEEFYKTKAEIQTLHSTNKELLDGQEDIGTIDAELQTKISQLDSCLVDLDLEHQSLEKAIQSVDQLDPESLDPDKGIVEVPEPLYGQIVNCFAEDAAISDAIYHLGEGLRTGRFPSLDMYLKKCRNLSRQQFYLRATMIKAREQSGLLNHHLNNQ